MSGCLDPRCDFERDVPDAAGRRRERSAQVFHADGPQRAVDILHTPNAGVIRDITDCRQDAIGVVRPPGTALVVRGTILAHHAHVVAGMLEHGWLDRQVARETHERVDEISKRTPVATPASVGAAAMRTR